MLKPELLEQLLDARAAQGKLNDARLDLERTTRSRNRLYDADLLADRVKLPLAESLERRADALEL